jgi:hypothetical protein
VHARISCPWLAAVLTWRAVAGWGRNFCCKQKLKMLFILNMAEYTKRMVLCKRFLRPLWMLLTIPKRTGCKDLTAVVTRITIENDFQNHYGGEGAGRRGMHERIIAAIPQSSADTMLEVALIQDDTHANVGLELRYLAWSAGLGWYRQQTLTLDHTAAQALLRTLRSVRDFFNTASLSGPRGKVIPFVGPAVWKNA